MRTLAICALVLGAVGCGRSELLVPAPAPRPLAPLSTSRLSSQRPRLRWSTPYSAARVELCRDPDCSMVVHTFASTSSSLVVPLALEPGAWFWRVRAVHDGVVGLPSAPPWELFVPHRDAGTASVDGAWMDFDRDGRADFVIVRDEGMSHPSIEVHLARDASVVTISGTSENMELAVGAHAAADINGDGYGDLLVPAGAASAAPRVLLGGEQGLSATNAWSVPLGSASDGHASGAVAVGDVDGDGYGDVAVATVQTPYVEIVRGGPSGWERTGTRSPVDHDLVLPRRLLGDFDGDGFDDVLVAENSSTTPASCAFTHGFVFRGSAAGLAMQPSVVLTDQGGRTLGQPAYISGSGDFDGDGTVDVVMRTCQFETTTALVIFDGSPDGLVSEPSQRIAETQSPGLPWFLGDVNADGYDDIGRSIDTGGAFTVGLLLGGTAGLAPTPTMSFASAPDVSGPVAGIGDVDGDGIDDVIAEGSSDRRALVRVCHGSVDAMFRCDAAMVGTVP